VSDIPEHWEEVRLSDICDIKYGNGLPQEKFTESGYPVFGANGVIGNYSEYMYEEEQVLISCRGAKSGKINLSPPKSFVTNNSLILLFQDKLNKTRKYFYYCLQAVDKSKIISGTAQPQVTISNAKDLKVPLPPVLEQQKIIDKIESLFTQLDAGVTSLHTAKTQLKRYRQSVLKHAFEGKLTEEWRENHQRNIDNAVNLQQRLSNKLNSYRLKSGHLKETEKLVLGKLPENWIWTLIDKIGDVSGGLTKNQRRTHYPNKVPYLRVANVYANELRLDDIKIIGVKESELERVLLRKNDLLVVEGNGSINQIGRVAIWDDSISPCVHQNHLIKIRFANIHLSKYVLYWLLSGEGREYITKVASSTSGLYTLSLLKVAALPVPLAPLTEQVEIVNRIEEQLSIIDGLLIQIEQEEKRSSNLRNSILKSAFEGNLISKDDFRPDNIVSELGVS